jgi:hypothetical protein
MEPSYTKYEAEGELEGTTDMLLAMMYAEDQQVVAGWVERDGEWLRYESGNLVAVAWSSNGSWVYQTSAMQLASLDFASRIDAIAAANARLANHSNLIAA